MFSESLMKKIGLFAGGVLFGTAGVKILSSKDAKKVYTECTAAALRAKDCVMKTVTNVQENAEDILAEAQQINEERAAQEAAAVQETEEDGADLSDEGTSRNSGSTSTWSMISSRIGRSWGSHLIAVRTRRRGTSFYLRALHVVATNRSA